MTDTTEVEAKPKPIKLTKKSVLEALEAAVQDRGAGYIYTDEYGTCEYVVVPYGRELKPGCLVGEALYRLGVPLEAMENNTTADNLLERLSENHVVSYRSQAVVSGLMAAQQKQDNGTPWGEAVTEAKKILK